jgi:hypothetical protein
MLTWPAIAVLLVLGILFEHSEARGWAIVTAIVASVVSFFYFSISLENFAFGSLAYLVIGIVWSFYRYKRYVGKAVSDAKESVMSDTQKEYLIRDLHPTKNLSTITAWIIVWPFSAIDNIAGDLINAIETLVKTVFRGVYHRIYESAVADIRKI